MLAGQTWTFAFSAPSGFGRDAAANVPWPVLLAGKLVAVLAAAVTQARTRAEHISHSLSPSQSCLERSQAEFKAVFRATQDTAVFTDPIGRVLFANDALQGSFGLNPSDLRCTMLADLHADARLLPRLDALPGPHLITTQFKRSADGINNDARPHQDLFYGEMLRSQVVGKAASVWATWRSFAT